ncbi:MAG: type II secretion system protein GspC [Thermodesulfobacteriota bacterium]
MPKQIHILLNLLALFVITYIVVDTFYRVIGIELHQMGGPKVVALKEVEMRGKKSLAVSAYTKIVERNIFGATEKVEAVPVEEVGPIETLEETSLQLSLQGTIAGDSASARAIILDQRKRSQDIYRVGDTVQEAQIRQILRGKVILRHGEKDEILIMVEGKDEPQPAAKVNSRRRPGRQTRRPAQTAPHEESSGEIEEVTIPIAKDVLQNSMNDLNDLMTQVRVRPYFRRGKPEGLIVSQIKSGSVFSKLGLMNGDIIANVNGKQMSSPEEAFQFYNSLKSGADVSIEITRRGKKKMFTYDIQ